MVLEPAGGAWLRVVGCNNKRQLGQVDMFSDSAHGMAGAATDRVMWSWATAVRRVDNLTDSSAAPASSVRRIDLPSRSLPGVNPSPEQQQV